MALLSWFYEIDLWIPDSDDVDVEIGWYTSNTEIFSGGIFIKFLDSQYSRRSITLRYKSRKTNESSILVGVFKNEFCQIQELLVSSKKSKMKILVKRCSEFCENEFCTNSNSFDFVENFSRCLKTNFDISTNSVIDKVQKLSKRRKQNHDYISEIEAQIKKDCSVSIGWYQKKGVLEHSGFVLIYDSKRQHTLDYGGENSTRLTAIRNRPRDTEYVQLLRYCDNYEFHGKICDISLGKFIDFLNFCLNSVKPFHMTNYNCRHFLEEAVLYLSEQVDLSISNVENLNRNIANIKNRDHAKLYSSVGIPLLGIAGLSVGPFVAFAAVAVSTVGASYYLTKKKRDFNRVRNKD